MNIHKRRGIKSFLNKNYKNAMTHFSLALQEKPKNKELRIYLNLASLAKAKEDEAVSLFEFYRASRKDKNSKKPRDFEKIIDSLQVSLEKIQSLFEGRDIERLLIEENGITYEDFLLLVEKRGGFARAFEDIMFSTKVLISKKEDFIHFLNLLVDNGFKEMALNYLENALLMFPAESSLRDIIEKVEH